MFWPQDGWVPYSFDEDQEMGTREGWEDKVSPEKREIEEKGATWLDLAQRLTDNEYEDEMLETLLWSQTPFPMAGVLTVARHLRLWDRRRRAGWSVCTICGRAYRNPGSVAIGGTCGPGLMCVTWEQMQREQEAA